MTSSLPVRYDDAFISSYLDGRLSPDDPVRQSFEAELVINSSLNQQMTALAQTRAQLQALAERLDASPRLPNLTETVMARFRQQFGGVSSPQKNPIASRPASTETITCGHLTPALICAWVDGELPMPQQALLSEHLNSCSICRRTADDLRRVSQKLRHMSVAPDTALPADDPWPGIQDHLVYGMTHAMQAGATPLPEQPLSRHPVIVRPNLRKPLFAAPHMLEDTRYQRPGNFSGFAPTQTPFGLAFRIILIMLVAFWIGSLLVKVIPFF